MRNASKENVTLGVSLKIFHYDIIIQNTSWRTGGTMKMGILLLAILVVLAVFNAILYIGSTSEPGFPLDDAWIHQVYARNLGTKGTMAFINGQPSTGSTAPAWSLLLALGYVLDIPHLYWAYILGTLFAILSAVIAALISNQYFGHSISPIIVAVICILEWHLAWASLSGMEITLFMFLSLLFFYMLNRKSHPVWMGLLTGVAFLVRPESFLLAGVYGLSQLFQFKGKWKPLALKIGTFSITLILVVFPLIIFNYIHGGKPFPNTVSAKYLQYGFPWSPIKSIYFLVDVTKFFFLGPLLLLAPFFLLMVYRVWVKKEKDLIYPLVWMGSLVGLYTFALPIIYHHGRYLMPLLPWIAIIGVEGVNIATDRFRGMRIFWPVYKLALMVMLVVLWINHAATYALQVNLLQESHVRIAEWIRNNTAPATVIATHDIGILGYMAEREIVDLVGLITPEVIPIMLNQNELADFTRQKGVEYLVVFSGYYQMLLNATGAQLVFSPDSIRLKNLGLEPFEVHQMLQD